MKSTVLDFNIPLLLESTTVRNGTHAGTHTCTHTHTLWEMLLSQARLGMHGPHGGRKRRMELMVLTSPQQLLRPH